MVSLFFWGRKPRPQEVAGIEPPPEQPVVIPPTSDLVRSLLEEEKYPEWLIELLSAWFSRDLKLSNLPPRIVDYLQWLADYTRVDLEEYLLSKVGGPNEYTSIEAYRDAVKRALIASDNFLVAATAILHRGLLGFERRALAYHRGF